VETAGRTVEGRGLGVDPDSGALLIDTDGGTLSIGSGEVLSCRLAEPATV
jgi:hypothetical protein